MSKMKRVVKAIGYSKGSFLVMALAAAFAFSGCNKSDEGMAASNFVGAWYLSSYEEDLNGNRTNDDQKMLLQPYENCSLTFTKDGKLQVHSQRDASNTYDFLFDWSVSSDNQVTLHLSNVTSSGTDTYNIQVAALSYNTMVLIHDQYNSAQALQYSPPHPYSLNWLIFTRQH